MSYFKHIFVRNSHRRCSVRKSVFTSFGKLIGNFENTSKNTFFTKHLWATVSDCFLSYVKDMVQLVNCNLHLNADDYFLSLLLR